MANNNQIYKMSNAGGFKSLNRYHDMLAGNPVFVAPSSYESIMTITVPAGGTSIMTFSTIPSTYKHLQVRILSQTNRSTYNVDSFGIAINLVGTGSLYTRHQMHSSNQALGTVDAYNQVSTPSINPFIDTTSSVAGSNVFGSAIIDIFDYTNTNKFPVIRALGGGDTNGSAAGYCGTVNLCSGLFASGVAITQFSMFPTYSSLFNEKTTAALYGIKG
jgi:hypothetical protein